MITINNLKIIILSLAVLAVVILWKDYQYEIAENNRKDENERQLKYIDSLQKSRLVLSENQINDYISSNEELKRIIKENRIKTNRIENILTQTLKYRDTVKKETKLPDVVISIKEDKDIIYPIIDSTQCLVIKGNIKYVNKELSLEITERTFKNKTIAVGFWERRQWKFLGIKTRFLGKKQATVVVTDQCGKSETIQIDKQ